VTFDGGNCVLVIDPLADPGTRVTVSALASYNCAYCSTTGQKHLFFTDSRGSVNLVTNDTGQEISASASENYQAYGSPDAPQTAGSDPGYNGSDAAGGLVYMRNRWYDPNTGRFTQQDPIGYAGGSNLYGYTGGDPVSFSDPYGLCCFLNSLANVVAGFGDAVTFGLTDAVRGAIDANGVIDQGSAAYGAGVVAGAASLAALTDGAGNEVEAGVGAANEGGGVLEEGTIYRNGGASPSNLKPGPDGTVSMRSTLSDPVGGKVFTKPEYTEIDVAKLPKGSAKLDNIPDGHVSVRASQQDIKAAVKATTKFPKT
jgi:RHS repeat-associated protein